MSELYLEPVIGYRVWKVRVEDTPTILRSIVYTHSWPHYGEMEAKCARTRTTWTPNAPVPHDTVCPVPACECGIYAVKTYDHALKMLKAIHYGTPVLGRVKLWGRIIDCERGYRAQYAYPLDLQTEDTGLDGLLKAYGVGEFIQPEAHVL